MSNINLKIFGIFLMAFVLTSGIIDLDNLFNYSLSNIPDNLNQGIDSAPSDNQMDDRIATLGRVLFYDKKLSSNNSISCASCHKQDHAFGVEELQGTGANGLSLRRPMRLLNLRSLPVSINRLFWDARVLNLEKLATQPIQDHIEMGYSGENGDLGFEDLILQLEEISYYNDLFTFAFGDNSITEDRISKSLAQFVRSIESYDSRFDEGYEMVDGGIGGQNIELNFPNYNEEENLGKALFVSDAILNNEGERIGGGVGCFHCHSIPTFTFIAENRNNGVTSEIEGSEVLNITRSPSLRDVFGPSGSLNGPLFHNGQGTSFNEVLNHYNNVTENNINNTNLDVRLSDNGIPLNLTIDEKQHLEAFIKTLTGTDIYTNEKWSDPFDSNGDIDIIGETVNIFNPGKENKIKLYPNPAQDFIKLQNIGDCFAKILNVKSKIVWQGSVENDMEININTLSKGIYTISLLNDKNVVFQNLKFVKI